MIPVIHDSVQTGFSGRFAAFSVALALLLLPTTGCQKAQKKDSRVPVSIRSVPEKVNINLISHGKKLGVTHWEGKLPPGTYVFEFTKPGYKTTWRKITCGVDREDLEVKMNPISASVILESDPTAATVATEDGKTIGETPITLPDLPVGKHSYILKKPGFSPRTVSFSIDDERPKLVKIDLSSNIGTIIARSNPPDANISVDGDPRGKTPSTIKLEQGEHIITITARGYAPYKEKVALSSGQTARVNALLQMLPASLTVTSDPSDSNLFVNGKQYNNTPTTIKNLTPGEYTIKIARDKYDDAVRTVTLGPGQELKVDMKLDSNMGGIDLVVHPPGVTVYVDGQKIGVTQQGETKDLSKVMEIRGLKSGEHIILVAHKRAVPLEKKFKIIIKKGKISRPRPVTLWIKDTYMKLKDGRKLTGRIIQEDDRRVLFEDAPGIRIGYDRKEIVEIRPLAPDE